MKRIKILNLVLFLAVFAMSGSTVFAQSKTKKEAKEKAAKVDHFAEGRTLTEADLGFLKAVTADPKSKSRGAVSDDVTIGSNTYKVGQVITADDAAAITKAIDESKNAEKVKNKDKSRGDCNLWCYYYLQDSYGNWYYYYYCCG